MAVKPFLKLVEIQTKVASMIPFLLGSLYAYFRFQQFDALHFVLMFASLLSFDMATTAMNNYFDYKKAVKTHGYGYEKHNAIVCYRLKEPVVIAVIGVLLLTAVGTGIWLVAETGLLLLLLGGLSFGVGILYSFGPLPISRMPVGELFSGLFMGFVIIFISAWIHLDPAQLAGLVLDGGMVYVQANLVEIILLFLVSVPAVLGIANIMLANNICDLEEDVENKRYTLPVYIGRQNALKLFRFLYILAYADLVVLLFLKVHPLLVLLVLLTVIPVRNNIKKFTAHPSKEKTFAVSVQNFIFMNAARIAVMGTAMVLAGF